MPHETDGVSRSGVSRSGEPGRAKRLKAEQQRALGNAGEDAVAEWYRSEGYEVLARNWRVRQGELDLVVGKGRLVVFCEVKSRTNDRFGAPAEAVTHAKRQRVRLLAAQWLDAQSRPVGGLRFDVACVTGSAGADPAIEIIEGAF